MNGKCLVSNLDLERIKESMELSDIKLKSIQKINRTNENVSIVLFSYKTIQSVFDLGRYYDSIVVNQPTEPIEKASKNESGELKHSPPKQARRK